MSNVAKPMFSQKVSTDRKEMSSATAIGSLDCGDAFVNVSTVSGVLAPTTAVTLVSDKDEKGQKLSLLKKMFIANPGKLRMGGKSGFRYETRVCRVITLQTSSVAARYLLTWTNGGATTTLYSLADIGNASEWTSFDAIFDEFFVRSVEFHFVPFNKYSANTTANTGTATAAGQPGFVNTLPCVVIPLQHNQGSYVDSSTVAELMANNSSSKWTNLGDEWKMTWQNVEKFSWDGPVGDSGTSTATTSWLNVALSAKLGGHMQAAVTEPTGASALIGTLYESAPFGVIMAKYDVAFRVRN